MTDTVPSQSDEDGLGAVILAAGRGVRMRSALPKVLHPLGGVALLSYPVALARALGCTPIVVVVGEAAAEIEAAGFPGVTFARQERPLGTADALRAGLAALPPSVGSVLVLNGDAPLLRVETARALIAAKADAAAILATAALTDPTGYGRIVRDDQGEVANIVEEQAATPEQRLLREVNAGVYVFAVEALGSALPAIRTSSVGEYYLTDVAAELRRAGGRVATHNVADVSEVFGVNDRVQLAEAEALLRARVNRQHQLDGVTIQDPASTWIEPTVRIASDVTILPGSILRGTTSIGAGCQVGPQTYLEHATLGERCVVRYSVVEKSQLGVGVTVGPYSHLRAGAVLDDGAHIGNFAEVKNAVLGPQVAMGHFSYIGDADIGARTNIGAGTITANYDGVQKNHTSVGAGAFLGCDTILRAPVHVGDGAVTGAGSVVTKDILDYTLSVGMPARMVRKLPVPMPGHESTNATVPLLSPLERGVQALGLEAPDPQPVTPQLTLIDSDTPVADGARAPSVDAARRVALALRALASRALAAHWAEQSIAERSTSVRAVVDIHFPTALVGPMVHARIGNALAELVSAMEFPEWASDNQRSHAARWVALAGLGELTGESARLHGLMLAERERAMTAPDSMMDSLARRAAIRVLDALRPVMAAPDRPGSIDRDDQP